MDVREDEFLSWWPNEPMVPFYDAVILDMHDTHRASAVGLTVRCLEINCRKICHPPRAVAPSQFAVTIGWRESNGKALQGLRVAVAPDSSRALAARGTVIVRDVSGFLCSTSRPIWSISPSLAPKHLTNAFGNLASTSFCRFRWEFHLLLGFVARKRWLHVGGGCTARHPWGGYCCFRTLGMDGSQCRIARARRCLHRPDIVREWSPFLDASEPPCFAAAPEGKLSSSLRTLEMLVLLSSS